MADFDVSPALARTRRLAETLLPQIRSDNSHWALISLVVPS